MESAILEVIREASPAGFLLRRLNAGDYERGFYQLLSNLTQVGEVSEATFAATLEQIANLPDMYIVLVMEEEATQRLAAAGTLLVEQKFIRSAGKAGHIEDIVVSPEFQRRGLGKKLIDALTAVAQTMHCYKVILDCCNDNVPFYEKCGLVSKGVFMARYF